MEDTNKPYTYNLIFLNKDGEIVGEKVIKLEKRETTVAETWKEISEWLEELHNQNPGSVQNPPKISDDLTLKEKKNLIDKAYTIKYKSHFTQDEFYQIHSMCPINHGFIISFSNYEEVSK